MDDSGGIVAAARRTVDSRRERWRGAAATLEMSDPPQAAPAAADGQDVQGGVKRSAEDAFDAAAGCAFRPPLSL